VADRKTFVIVGAGMAGAKAAETLREEGFDGRVVLVGAERELPYERPPLSKGYLAGESAREDARVHPEGFHPEHDIELVTGATATSLDPGAHTVELDDGRVLAYDRLLIATGAVPARPPIAGAGLEGVRVLRTLADADTLRADLARGGPLVVVGAGWIGCEVAASARGLGVDVTLLEYADTPLQRVLGSELGRFFAGVHREHGVRVLTGARVEAIEGDGRARAVRLAGGERVEGETVVLGVGARPETRLAEAAGLLVDDGIRVDGLLRTSHPDVFAAGDAASCHNDRYGRHVRVEHWANALEQGPAAARAMLDRGRPYDALPYFFSDQYDVGLEYTGLHSAADRVVIRGRPEERRLQAFWLSPGGRITAGMHVNEWDSLEPIKRLVDAGAVVDPRRLADEGIPLDDLAAAPDDAPAEGVR
jgi:3-phenylpropionate/trans-cinnamate dioxygenase ferredoxin reductase subunit